MNKEMTPLQALKKIKQARYFVDFELDAKVSEDYKKELDIIETALKDYEKKTKLAKEYKDVNNVAKRLKALEIIKEKRVFIEELISSDNVDEYNDYVDEQGRYDEDKLTQAEFDLLKEVLL